ncbi:Aldo keto reductase [Crepidotus variabilis]|uniref:Aldo keto reductase n=1 Tax=Crepidotus variabilis TaxID=179855 RepID=A0A9P6JMP3_9AGAR|nr:Aldo keto reductase [Crepidotus variabilis]
MSLSMRKIGKDSIPKIGFGAMRMSTPGSEAFSDEERLDFLDAVFAEGCTFWDTADRYGDNEVLIGKWLKRSGRRDQIFLATKFGATKGGPNNSPEYMRAQFENSLKLLGTDRIDLYYAHRVDKNTPIEKTIRSMAELVEEVEYSPFALEIEEIGFLQACRELGVTIVAYSPLGRGILTGAYRKHVDLPENDMRRLIPKFSQENFPKILDLVECLTNIGKKHDATPGQVTLAWLLAQGQDIIPIPGTKNVQYLKENVAAVKIRLSVDELAEVRRAIAQADLGGFDRYPPGSTQDLFADTAKE